MFLGAQSKFRKASAGVVAAVDCNSVSVGVDSGHYEGPLRVRLPVKLSPASSAEGAWSFVVPLPDPASQKLLSRSVISAKLSAEQTSTKLSLGGPTPSEPHLNMRVGLQADRGTEGRAELAACPDALACQGVAATPAAQALRS